MIENKFVRIKKAEIIGGRWVGSEQYYREVMSAPTIGDFVIVEDCFCEVVSLNVVLETRTFEIGYITLFKRISDEP